MPTSSTNGLNFAPVKSKDEALEAWGLVYRAYRRIGIVPESTSKTHTTPHLFSNTSTTICGRIGGLCVSTISAYLDHPEHGLPLDVEYPNELAELRRQGKKLIEVGLFADRRVTLNRSLHALLELIRYATYFGINHGHGDAVIGIHPHHAPFYARAMGFRPIGPERSHDKLNDAPVVLMYMDWNHAVQQKRLNRGIKYCLNHPVPMSWFDGRYEEAPAHPAENDERNAA